MALNSGPFTFEPGDTQEVVLAVIGGLQPAGNRLTSVTRLKEHARVLREIFFSGIPNEPLLSCQTTFYPDSTVLEIRADLSSSPGATSCKVTFRPQNGQENEFALLLYDDGQHGDSLAGDGIWGNRIAVTNRRYPYDADLSLFTASGEERLPAMLTDLRLRPLPELVDWQVVWENGRQDCKMNPGEKVHLTFKIRNTDAVSPIQGIHIFDGRNHLIIDCTIAPSGTLAVDSLYLVEVTPSQGESFDLRLNLQFDQHLLQTFVTLPLEPWGQPAAWGDTLAVMSVKGFPYNVIPVVADPGALTGEQYSVWFRYHPGLDTPVWNLTNLTRGEDLLLDRLPGNSAEEDFPVVDGIEWNVIFPKPDLLAVVEVANRLGPLPPEEWDSVGAPFGGNNVWHSPSASSNLNQFYLSAGLTGTINKITGWLSNAQNHDFEIRFTDDGGILLWPSEGDLWAQVPFEAWDVGMGTYDDPSDDIRCITLAYSSGTTPGILDFGYTDPYLGFPATDWIKIEVPMDSLGTYERFYEDVTTGTMSYEWGQHMKPVLIRIIICDYSGNNALPETGTVVRFITTKLNYPGDSLIVNAVVGVQAIPAPHSFELAQNFPNPFNSTTTIRFSIQQLTPVKLEIFNVLGQKVATLIDRKMAAGKYEIRWEGKRANGEAVASGVYLYHLKAGDYEKVRKMILLR